LESYRAERKKLAGNVPLGNLISTGESVVSASAGGIAVLVRFEPARAKLAEELEKARTAAERGDLRVRLGELNLFAGHLDDAEEQFREAEKEAQREGRMELERLRTQLFDMLVNRTAANPADNNADRLLATAERYADAPQQQVAVLLCKIGQEEAANRPTKAAEFAQMLSEKYSDILIDPLHRKPDAAESTAISGYELGQRELERLIRKHGQRAYAGQDRQLDEAFRRAKSKQDIDAMLTAHHRFPHAARAAESLLAVGEILYRRAFAASPPDLTAAARAHRVLGEVKNYDDPELRRRARVGQALIDGHLRPELTGVNYLDVKSGGRGTRASFADFSGSIAELFEQTKVVRVGEGSAFADPLRTAAAPLRRLYRFDGADSKVLRDTAGQPMCLGERVFVRSGERLLCIDSQLNDPRAAVVWSARLPEAFRSETALGQLTSDRQQVVVVCAQALVAFDAARGTVAYEKSVRDRTMQIGSWTKAVGDGDWLALVGLREDLHCLNVARGERIWQTNIHGGAASVRQVKQEFLLLADEKGTRAECYDARSGQVRLLLRPASQTRFLLTSNGLLLALDSGGTLAIYDSRRGEEEPMGKVSVGGGGELLATRGPLLALSLQDEKDPLRLVDMADLGKPRTLAGPKTSTMSRRPVGAEFVDGGLYVLWGEPADREGGSASQLLTVPAVCAYELPSGRMRFCAELAPATDGPCRVAVPHAGPGAISVLLTPLDPQLPSRQLLVATPSGNLVDCVTRRATSSGLLETIERARHDAGGPVILNGRVILRHSVALELLRSDL
jgi:hypothetical protein